MKHIKQRFVIAAQSMNPEVKWGLGFLTAFALMVWLVW